MKSAATKSTATEQDVSAWFYRNDQHRLSLACSMATGFELTLTHPTEWIWIGQLWGLGEILRLGAEGLGSGVASELRGWTVLSGGPSS